MLENQFDSAIRQGQYFLSGYKGPSAGSQPYRLLKRLFSEAAERKEPDRYEFTWKDINETADVDDEGKQLKKNISTAIEKWAGHRDALTEQAIESGNMYIPVFEKIAQGKGAGNMNRYVIRAEAISAEASAEKIHVPEGYIRYTLEMVERPNWVGRIINGVVAKGWVWRSMVGAIVFAVGCAMVMILLGLATFTVQQSAFGMVKVLANVLITLVALYSTFSPLYYCVTNRIILAPIMMTSGGLRSTQLEYAETVQYHQSGKRVRQFRLVSYSATCQLCKGRVEIEKGRWRMFGRLVGRCDASPREHVYSFDHKTRLGRLVYPEYAVLADKVMS